MPESPPPVGREKAHPLALRLFTLLRDRSDEDRRLVFEVLAERLGHSSSDVKREVLDALEAYRAETGRLPTVERCPALASREPARALRAVGQPDPITVRRLERRRVRDALGPGRRSDGDSASLDGQAVQPRGGNRRARRVRRLPAAGHRPHGLPLPLLGGGAGRRRPPRADVRHNRQARLSRWHDALAAAGIEYPGQTQSWARQTRAFTDADARIALRDFWAECGAPATCPRCDAWSRRRNADSGPTPRASTIARVFGGWKNAVCQVIGPDARENRGKSPTYAPAELWVALHRCAAELGHPPRRAEYDAWRLRQKDRCPSVHTLAKHLGGGTWRGVISALNREGTGR